MIKLTGSKQELSSEHMAQARRGLDQLLARQDVGFFRVVEQESMWQACAQRAQQVGERFAYSCVVGIGGSSLGAQAIAEALGPCLTAEACHEMFFFSGPHHESFARVWRIIARDLSRVHFLLISKSGSTFETLAWADFLAELLERHNLRLCDQATVICENHPSPLQDWAKLHRVSQLEIPMDIGGRYSVLTAVGMLPAAILGWNIDEFRQGARSILNQKNLVSQTVAHALASFSRQEWITMSWWYNDLMRGFNAWWQQLWAESLAKMKTRSGPPAARVSTPMTCVGPEDQHSLLQQVVEGAHDKWVLLHQISGRAANTGERTNVQRLFDLPVKHSEFKQDVFEQHCMSDLLTANFQATAQALNEYRVSNLCFEVTDLSPRSLGALFMYWELVVATLGECLDVNAFDQPGVELGKQFVRKILAQK